MAFSVLLKKGGRDDKSRSIQARCSPVMWSPCGRAGSRALTLAGAGRPGHGQQLGRQRGQRGQGARRDEAPGPELHRRGGAPAQGARGGGQRVCTACLGPDGGTCRAGQADQAAACPGEQRQAGCSRGQGSQGAPVAALTAAWCTACPGSYTHVAPPRPAAAASPAAGVRLPGSPHVLDLGRAAPSSLKRERRSARPSAGRGPWAARLGSAASGVQLQSTRPCAPAAPGTTAFAALRTHPSAGRLPCVVRGAEIWWTLTKRGKSVSPQTDGAGVPAGSLASSCGL